MFDDKLQCLNCGNKMFLIVMNPQQQVLIKCESCAYNFLPEDTKESVTANYKLDDLEQPVLYIGSDPAFQIF